MRIPVRFAGDIWNPTWTPAGRSAAVGQSFVASIWHYHPVKER